MKTNFSLLFYMKKQKNYENGAAPIYLRITVAGKRAEITTGRECEPERWNSRAGRISGLILKTSHMSLSVILSFFSVPKRNVLIILRLSM